MKSRRRAATKSRHRSSHEEPPQEQPRRAAAGAATQSSRRSSHEEQPQEQPRRATARAAVTAVAGQRRPRNFGEKLGASYIEMTAVYDHHYSHSIIHITTISSFTPSSTACPVGVQFLPWMRGGSAVSSSTTTYFGMLSWAREHRNSMTMHIPPIDQLPRRRKSTTTISPALWLLSFHCSS